MLILWFASIFGTVWNTKEKFIKKKGIFSLLLRTKESFLMPIKITTKQKRYMIVIIDMFLLENQYCKYYKI